MRRKQTRTSGRPVTRRHFGQLGFGALLASLVGGLPRRVRADDHLLVTDLPENAPILSATQYVNETAQPGKNCGNCILYQAGDGGRGKCPIFAKGSVPENAWCISWSPKS